MSFLFPRALNLLFNPKNKSGFFVILNACYFIKEVFASSCPFFSRVPSVSRLEYLKNCFVFLRHNSEIELLPRVESNCHCGRALFSIKLVKVCIPNRLLALGKRTDESYGSSRRFLSCWLKDN